MRSRLKTALRSLALALLCMGLAACSISNAPASEFSSSNSSTTSNSAYNRSSGTAAEQLLDEVVFPRDKVVDVKITMDEDDFQDMLDNASAEEYKPASVNYNGQKIDNIGIRTKGNLTLRSVVQMADSDRYSFKLSFNEYVNQTLAGLEKINLNNNYSDASYMREYLAYELAETMGLPTPKYSFVNIYINGELWGFYLAVEQIGTSYLERHFDNAYGALYKGVMTGSGSDLLWLDDNPESYTGLELKSNSHNGNVLIDMLDELNHGSDYESVLFVEEALKYIALNVVTNNTDSYIGGNKQNYYLYEVDGIFSILPWDYNMAFGGLGGGMGIGRGEPGRNQRAEDTENSVPAAPVPEARQDTPIGDDTNQRAADAAQGPSGTSLLIDEPTQGTLAERPLVAKLLAVDAYKERYHSIIEEAIEGYLSEDRFSARVEQLNQMIATYVEQDPTAFYTYEEYQQGVTQLMSSNAKQVDNIAQQLAGTIPSSGDGSGSGGGMGGGTRGGMGGNMGARFNAGAAPDTPANINAPTDAAGEQGATPTEARQEAPDQQGAIPAQAAQEAPDQQGAIPVQAAQEAPDQQGAIPAQAGQEAPDLQEGAPAGGNQQFVPNGQMPQGEFQGGRRAPDGMGFGGPGGFGPQNSQQQGSSSEAITAGISLLVLLAASAFVLYFRRKRL
ncbi:CotH kinase family protein [Paenibacillus bouchesdurhonensis]|uniref:CotH kinase family protein n=1 Tax=Paenibacillus bouchesdurhonensis TaxID=1870990 RepID=UPI000DA635A9|nr:CotH kinase family protein [Paenibacillus bouchesdurhonensis]